MKKDLILLKLLQTCLYYVCFQQCGCYFAYQLSSGKSLLTRIWILKEKTYTSLKINQNILWKSLKKLYSKIKSFLRTNISWFCTSGGSGSEFLFLGIRQNNSAVQQGNWLHYLYENNSAVQQGNWLHYLYGNVKECLMIWKP